MKIEITDHRKIFSVQKEFNELFPFLKIEFFAKPHTAGGASPEKLITHAAKTIGSCRTMHRKGFLSLSPNMSVRELKQTFADKYGLSVRILKRDKSGWMDTSVKDAWSLDQHNTEGQKSGLKLEKV